MENNIGDARRAYADSVGGFTQEDAAKYFGVSLSTYKKWEQGQGKMNGAQLRSIAEKYGVTTDYLLQRSQIMKRAVVSDPAERELVDIYRSLNAYGRDQLMVFARGCAESYPKNTADSMGA